jgi:hypothetical protein
MFRKKAPKRSDFALLKRKKEVKEDPHLMANGRRRFPCLVANGRKMRRFFFTSSHFPPKKLYLKLLFFL